MTSKEKNTRVDTDILHRDDLKRKGKIEELMREKVKTVRTKKTRESGD